MPSLCYAYYTFAYQRHISGKNIFVYQSQRTVLYFMQIMRPANDAAYELRFCDVPVAYGPVLYPWLMRGVHVALLRQIILMCNVPVLRFFMALVWYMYLFSLY